jgi:hypothetical protein
MKHTRQRLTRLLSTSASVALGWWLFDLAGVSHVTSLSQFFCFMFCVLGIERVMSAVIDLVTIALTPIETLKQRD